MAELLLNPSFIKVMTGPFGGFMTVMVVCLIFRADFRLMLKKFEGVNRELTETFRIELEACNKRYEAIFQELMKEK